MKRSSKPKLPQGITKRELAEARKEMAVWKKRLKSKDLFAPAIPWTRNSSLLRSQ